MGTSAGAPHWISATPGQPSPPVSSMGVVNFSLRRHRLQTRKPETSAKTRARLRAPPRMGHSILKWAGGAAAPSDRVQIRSCPWDANPVCPQRVSSLPPPNAHPYKSPFLSQFSLVSYILSLRPPFCPNNHLPRSRIRLPPAPSSRI